MNYKTFQDYICSTIQRLEGPNTKIIIRTIVKNNDLHLDGLTIQKGELNISPTIYLNDFYKSYQDGISMETICDDILGLYYTSQNKRPPDLSFFSNYDQLKEHIVFKLISYQSNLTLLENVPHFRYLDFAVVFNCLVLDTSAGNATILIQNQHLKLWGITGEVLYELAKTNTPKLLPPKVCPMKDLLTEAITGKQEYYYQEEDSPIYVLTNTAKLHGAACILYDDLLENISKEFDCSLYIIPSSIHEVLLLSGYKELDITLLNNIIKEVNMSYVSRDEILSDHAYFFSKENHLISF